MDKELTKYELRRRGITLADLARDLGCDRSLISKVISGEGTSRRVSEAIARALATEADR
ncbi:MAG: transcriptional regulator [Synechococcales cyanobacterium RU_4_20]|nr:transcriptional regulator [Synechococcales cyanobacterium RU_4_20]NJR71296.1 transcriptional regulator [Synechococcales cyanobacterium CRU_2_2]